MRPSDSTGHSLPSVPFYPAEVDRRDDAALAMVIDAWHPPGLFARLRPQWRARRIAQVQSDEPLESFLRERGLWAYWGEGGLDDVKVRLRADVPMLVTLQERPLDPATVTLVLVAGYDDARERLLLYGLGDEPVELAYDEFERRWRRGLSRWLSVVPPERATWVLTGAERVSRGRYYMAEQRYEAAARDFEAALALNPDRALHYIELADAHLMQGEFAAAESLYRAALRLDESNPRAMNNLAYTLIYSGGDLEEAQRWARNAVAREPGNARLLDTLGVALHRAGAYKEAARVLERARTRAMTLDGPTQAVIALHLVQVYHDDEIWHLARQTMADALTHNPRLDVPEELRVHIRPEQAGR